jgi:endonuclease/exonuclease/phosphatase family metal-dependent hydrolase
MIYRFEMLLRKARLWLSRSEWMIRLLGLAKSKEMASAPGLVIIQIDGLSHTQLSRALEKGNMPFLFNILKRERYRLHTHYSGMPSSTPAVQGELFYGVKCATPAFSFMDRKTGQIIRMFDPASAAGVEHKLDEKGESLLKGGSSYCDIYTGGAEESHFCPSSLGWGAVLRAANPLALGFFVLSNAYSFVRTAVLLVIEFFLAIVDCIRGLIDGRDLVKELKFVLTRVGICILLRELITIGAKIDIARGLPAVHLNFVGYDEQAHRRGPSSLFAHWALKGIDDSIARIWRAAKRSARRDYDVWVYSDHGQEETLPYPKEHGRTVEEAVAEVFDRFEDERTDVRPGGLRGIQSQRVRLLGGKRIQKLLAVHSEAEQEPKSSQFAMTAMGPLGMVYTSRELVPAARDNIASQLVESAKIPLVLATDGPARLRAWTEEGEFVLPEQNEKILGSDHPFLEEVTRDLIELCQHPNAGEFVICGWRTNSTPYSFPIENGSHAGPGSEETKAFALLPADTPLAERDRDYLRPMDLRHAAFHVLGRSEIKILTEPNRKPAAGQTLRLMTYNVHSCVGMDGRISPERIARVIAQHAPDIVAIQELDVGTSRANGVDQAHLIARNLQMEFHFHPSIRMEKGLYGNAILTRFPMRLVKAGKLPGLPNKPHIEPRGVLWAAIDVDGTEIQFFNTHLGLRPRERLVQAQALLDDDWLGHPDCHEPVILCGDFNALPSWPVCLRLRGRLHDAQIALNGYRQKNTWFGRYPCACIDHVFVDPSIEVADIEVPNTELTRVASDHLPLIADVRIPQPSIPPA